MKQDTKISNYCKFDSQLLTTFTSSLYVAGLIASFFASPVTRTFGRKASILVGGAAFLIGAALGGAALNIYMLILGRVMLGVGIGFANQSVPLYLSEMAPPRYRGAINIGFQLCVGIGVLSSNLINFGTEKIEGGWGWRISLAMAAVPASMLTLGSFFLPETPNSIIQHSKDHHKAKLMLQRIRGTNDVQHELEDLIEASNTSHSIKHPFKNILQRKYRPHCDGNSHTLLPTIHWNKCHFLLCSNPLPNHWIRRKRFAFVCSYDRGCRNHFNIHINAYG
uniref:Hexose carrier protein HEX6 n=1 Tax=Cajanus cajan TaxID=3821 RepID=A0A151RFZ0_CAJCA|nr:Hexose carrier protein HEX6 [Cajanus cajan]